MVQSPNSARSIAAAASSMLALWRAAQILGFPGACLSRSMRSSTSLILRRRDSPGGPSEVEFRALVMAMSIFAFNGR